MTKSRTRAFEAQTKPAASNAFRKRLMFAASAGILAVAMPSAGVYGTRAFAQTLPDECEDTNPADPNNLNVGNGQADPGETIECVQSDSNQPLDRLGLNVEDLTLTIGDGVTPTAIVPPTGSGTATINLNGTGDQSVTIEDEAVVTGVGPVNPGAVSAALNVRTQDGSINIVNKGTINTVPRAQPSSTRSASASACTPKCRSLIRSSAMSDMTPSAARI